MIAKSKDHEREFLTPLISIFRPILGDFIPELNEQDTGYKLIQGPFDFKRPEDPYAYISVLDDEKIGQTYKGLVTDEGQCHEQDIMVRVRIQAYGAGALSAISRLERRIEDTSTNDKLSHVGYSWTGNSRAQEVTKLVSNHHQEQAFLDIYLATRFKWLDRLIVPIRSAAVELRTTESSDFHPSELVKTINIT